MQAADLAHELKLGPQVVESAFKQQKLPVRDIGAGHLLLARAGVALFRL